MKRIVDTIGSMSGRYHASDIFYDWVEMIAISISNRLNFNQELEDNYLSIARKYTTEQLNELSRMASVLVELFEKEIHDYLGTIYMMIDAGNKRTGQFFTPFHLCELMARLEVERYDGKEKITVNEPSVGGGGNILAFAKALKEKGYNYQELCEVEAQDLDFKCVYMSYVQFSLIGLSAVVIQGDTLANQQNLKLYTPMYFLRGGVNGEK